MADDLVARLRVWDHNALTTTNQERREAAARIEELKAENARLVGHHGTSPPDDLWQRLIDQAVDEYSDRGCLLREAAARGRDLEARQWPQATDPETQRAMKAGAEALEQVGPLKVEIVRLAERNKVIKAALREIVEIARTARNGGCHDAPRKTTTVEALTALILAADAACCRDLGSMAALEAATIAAHEVVGGPPLGVHLPADQRAQQGGHHAQ